MKLAFLVAFLSTLTACSVKPSSPPSSDIGQSNTFLQHEMNHLSKRAGLKTVRNPDGIYEFNLPGDWQERQNPGGKIEKMFIAPGNSASFFVLRISNPPDAEIKASQLKAYTEGLRSRYQNLHVLQEEVAGKYGTSIGMVSFTYDEKTPNGPLNIHNYCEVIIHKKNYFNVCGVAPTSTWERQKQNIADIFSSLKLINFPGQEPMKRAKSGIEVK